MGCLARLGCLIVLAVACVAAWFTRDRWLPERFRGHAAAATWQPVTPRGAERARDALARLSQPGGPVYQTLSAGDVASFAFSQATTLTGGSVDSVAARIDGDRMSVRARVALSALADKLGPLAGLLHDRETVELTGTFHMVRPGLGELQVERAAVGAVTLPRGMIPRLVRQLEPRRPAGLADAALPLPVPPYVSDIRIANGTVTLYKNVR